MGDFLRLFIHFYPLNVPPLGLPKAERLALLPNFWGERFSILEVLRRRWETWKKHEGDMERVRGEGGRN